MSSENNLLVEVQDLTWGYPKSPSLVFDKFNFKLYENDFCFILGKSGVGKTTLTKFLIRQLIPPKKMLFHRKEDLSRLKESEVQRYRRKIGVIYQDFKLIDWKTVQENVKYPLYIAGDKPDKMDKKVDQVLYKMGLMDKKDSYIPQLSGGEKQRVSMARALISNPEFIIADEPTGNLDWEASTNIADILIDLNKQGNTILFITHDLNLINYVKDKHNVKKINL